MHRLFVCVDPALPSTPAQADLGDSYVPYNKPGSIKHWLETTNVTEDFVFFIDADMVCQTGDSHRRDPWGSC